MKFNGRKVATGALAAAAAMALCGALAGCSANGASTSASSSGSTATEPDNHVVLGYWGGTCEAPIYIGYEKGFFQEEGLDPEMLLITSAASRALPAPTPVSPAWLTWRARRWLLTWAPSPRSR